MAEWVKREHTKGDIDRAGALLVPWWKMEAEQPKDLGWAYRVIENWRTSHAMPLLVFRMGLQNRTRRVEKNALVAQRLKRFSSAMNKLAREPHMKLSQMHDLGGCRSIVSTTEAVERLYDLYRGNQGQSQGLFGSEGKLRCYDYIRGPKPDGYRGIHVVGRYSARLEKNDPWNGQRIEIQLRSRLQHAFATAVETVTTFTREPLKFGAGPDEWRRFFSLMGSALAFREGTTLVDGTPSDVKELADELRNLTNKLRVRVRLRGWTHAMKQMRRRSIANAKWLLLVLDAHANTINVTGYRTRKEASKELAGIENSARPENLDAVLVWVNSVKDLRRAYPNYYADTGEFISALKVATRG